MTHKLITAALAASLMSSTALADEGPTLNIQDFIGTIEWSQGESLSAEIIRDGDTLDVSRDNNSVIIDGGLNEIDTTNCKGYSGKYSFSWGWGKKEDKNSSGRIGGYKNLDEMPKLSVTVPVGTQIVIDDAIPFTLGTPNVSSLTANIIGCGDIEIGDVSDFIDFKSKGSGDLTAGNTRKAKLSVSGSSDVELGNVDSLKLNISGSGDADIASAGNVDVSISGSGDLDIDDVSGSVIADSRGSGDMAFGNIRDNLAYTGQGSGDFYADSASGRVSLEVSGSGDVEVDGGDASELYITASGSSNVYYEGTAERAVLRASGSSDIEVERVTGELTQTDSGSADIHIGKTN